MRKTDRPTEPESEIDERRRDTREGREPVMNETNKKTKSVKAK